MSEPERSQKPDGECDDKYDWNESDKVCELCGMLVWETPWFDDPPENGGSCIGLNFKCGACGWEGSQ